VIQTSHLRTARTRTRDSDHRAVRRRLYAAKRKTSVWTITVIPGSLDNDSEVAKTDQRAGGPRQIAFRRLRVA
jgi:hypothetical protein